MKAYEVSVKVTPQGQLELPAALLKALPRGKVVRVIILIDGSAGADEEAAWAHLTAEQFLSGYGEADAIYDRAP